MKTSFGLTLLGFLFLFACGETPGADSTSGGPTNAPAEPTAVAVSTNTATTQEEPAPVNNQLKEAEEAFKAEVQETPAPEDEDEEVEMDYENIENPQPKKKPVTQPAKTSPINTEIEAVIPQKSETPTPDSEAPKSDTSPAEEKEVSPSNEQPEETIPAEIPAKFNHDLLNDLLTKHVSSTGKVNYQAFKADEAKLDEYLKTLEETPISDDWSREKQMAYYINAYNAATIKLILKNWPVGKITDLDGGKTWSIKRVNLGGKTYSLDAIENDILRPKYNDARIHFAVNCAAKSCPPLLNKAWTESNLNTNLDRQARSFINNPAYNTLSANSVEISKIFDWYSKDFGDITDYLNQYAKTKIDDNARVEYKEYNWALNN